MVKVRMTATCFWYILICVGAGIATYSPLGLQGLLSSVTPLLRAAIAFIMTMLMLFLVMGSKDIIEWDG